MKYKIGDIVCISNQDPEVEISSYVNKVGKIIDILEQELYDFYIRVEFYDQNMEISSDSCFTEEELTPADELIGYNFDSESKETNLSEEDKSDKGEVSDGYHTFNELYYHRMMLFAVICNTYKEHAWKSDKHADGSMYDGYFIVGINTPEGSYTYHYKLEDWDLFKVTELQTAPEWDGHKPEDITRLLSLLKSETGMTSND